MELGEWNWNWLTNSNFVVRRAFFGRNWNSAESIFPSVLPPKFLPPEVFFPNSILAPMSSLHFAVRARRSRERRRADAGGRGFALVTTDEGRFFSNGFDLAWARSRGSASTARVRLQSMVSLFRPLVADLLSLPMPTIAAVTGHAAAISFMLAISHDYVEMRGDRGILYMSELDIGMPFPPYFLALMRSKNTDPKVLRGIVLEGKKIDVSEATTKGIIDRVYGSIRRATLQEIRSVVRLPEETDEERQNLLAASKL